MSPAIASRFTAGARAIPFSIPTLATHHPRQLLVSGMIALWAGRLGYYLFGVSPSHNLSTTPTSASARGAVREVSAHSGTDLAYTMSHSSLGVSLTM